MYQENHFVESRGEYPELKQLGSNIVAAGYIDENQCPWSSE